MGRRDDIPVVSISTLKPKGLPFEIDGEIYESLSPSAWGMVEARNIRQHLRAIQKFEERVQSDDAPDATDAEIAVYHEHCRSFIRVVLPTLPESVLKEIHGGDLETLVGVFLAALGKSRAEAISALNGTTSTSAKPSRESAGPIPA